MEFQTEKLPSLEILIREISASYFSLKESKGTLEGDPKTKKNRKPGLKESFFDEATKRQWSLAQKTFLSSIGEEDKAREEAARRNPGWLVISTSYDEDGVHVLLREDPKYKPFSYVDKKTEMVWSKQIASGQAEYDIEKLREEDPDLWVRVSKLERVPRDFEDIDPEDLPKVQDYIYPGPLQIKLATPRKAKAEELE